jgi:hypothetical protein
MWTLTEVPIQTIDWERKMTGIVLKRHCALLFSEKQLGRPIFFPFERYPVKKSPTG